MTTSAHNIFSKKHAVTWCFSPSNSNIAEVESNAESIRALPRCSNVAYFNGKEKDHESGFHYYGARYYWSEVLTGWLSVDPMEDKYPGISPYAYCAWNPVKLVDPDGREVVLPGDKVWAQKIVNDLNAIYKYVYRTDVNAFKLQHINDDKGNVYNRLGVNEAFDWKRDKYTKAMKDCFDSPVKVTIRIVKNHNPEGPTLSRGRKINDFIEELGGGMTQGRTVYVSEDLPTYSKENGTQGKFARNHCLGGIVMHELLYHLHDVGAEDAAESREGPKIMQSHYLLKRSREHSAGNGQVFHSKKKKSR